MSRPSPSRTTRRYDRIAAMYDGFEAPMDWMGGRRRRRRVIRQASGRTLEVGIGTGRNLSAYPEDVRLTGVDLSARMLERTEARAQRLEAPVRLERADAEHLPFADDSFDTVTATSVFCSVDDPVGGLEEIRRVVKPGGRVLLLEHVRPTGRLLGWIFDRLAPIVRRLFGPFINRRTERNVRQAGLEIVDLRRHGIWREIIARPSTTGD